MSALETLRSSVGKKYVMAVTGLALLGFVAAHLAGNLLIYLGPNALNAYAQKLSNLGALLWLARSGLLMAVVLHIGTGIALAVENRKARPVPYHRKKPIQNTAAARTIVLSGLVILSFVVYHLLHFTFRVTHPEISYLHDALGRHDVYSMVVRSFQDPLLSLSYMFAMAFLALHLSHGFASSFQSLGWNNEKACECLEKMGDLFALVIFLGYSSIPLAVLLGWVRISGGAS